MPIEITDAFRVALNWAGPSGVTATNVIGVVNDSNDEIQTATDVLASLVPHMFEGMPGSFTLQTIVCTFLSNPNRTAEIDGGGFNSESGSGQFSPASCYVVKHTTAFGGRSGRGRTYVGPLLEGAIENGMLGTGIAADANDAWETFRENLLALPSGTIFSVLSPTQLDSHPVINSVASSVLGTQRRRQGRLWG